ncbi:MAG TPA: FeoA domain-containing protein [Phycisphaerae bacterium]|nr:FeoA domain-containing protein [Phycisphaerae bacterium]
MMLPQTLATAPSGQELRIEAICTKDGCHRRRLRELGLLEGRVVRILANRDPMICQVGQCRLGLCRRLASGVLVSPVTPLSTCKQAG